MRVVAENGTNSACNLAEFATAKAITFFGENHDAAAFGCLVGQGR